MNFNVQLFWKSKNHLVLFLYLNFSIEKKIKTLFLIWYFNLSKKWNGTLGTRIYKYAIFGFYFAFSDVIYQPIMNSNCSNVVSPVLLLYSDTPGVVLNESNHILHSSHQLLIIKNRLISENKIKIYQCSKRLLTERIQLFWFRTFNAYIWCILRY